jgi:hypothetical protein
VEEAAAAEAEVVAAEEHRMRWAAEDISAVVDTSEAADISAAALALAAECVLAERASAVRISAVRISGAGAWAAGLGYRGLRRGQVSTVNVRLRSAAIRTGPLAARRR